MSKTVIVVGAGILGCVAVSEFLEAGLNVILINKPPNQKPNIKSSGISINQELIPSGIGGGGNSWSSLSALITKEEWSRYIIGSEIPESSYRDLISNFRRASLYGFPSMDQVAQIQTDLRFKTFFKPSRSYDFANLLSNRHGLKVIIGNITNISISDCKAIVNVQASGESITVHGDKIIFAAGGLGNFELISDLFGVTDGQVFLHLKAVVGNVKFTNAGVEFGRSVGYNNLGSMIYYRGFAGKYSPNYVQIIPCKYYHTDSFVELLQIYKLIRSSNFLNSRSFSSLIKVVGRLNQFIYLTKILIGSVVPAFFWFVHKVFRISTDDNCAKLILHFSPDSARLIKSTDAVKIIQDKIDLVSGEELLNELYCYLDSNKYIKSFKLNVSCRDFQNANHYMGTAVKFIDAKNYGYLSGRLKGYSNAYTIGTSNIWFKNNVNPTFLSLAMSFFTIDEVVRDLSCQ